MRFISLYYNSEKITNPSIINSILQKENLQWLFDCEIENAQIEIKNKTLIWKSGTLYSGNWYFGIWEEGTFHGTWENGIWVGGTQKGKIK